MKNQVKCKYVKNLIATAKKVINNAAMDGHRTFGCIQKYECSLDEISLENIESLYYFDTYPSDLNVFMLENYRVVIHNDRLADAFRVLQEELRDILLIYWFLGTVDIEIAERKRLSRRAVNRKRNKAFCFLKDLLGDESL